jgi:predicted membrane protein
VCFINFHIVKALMALMSISLSRCVAFDPDDYTAHVVSFMV